MTTLTRRYDIDWLRVIAIGLLFIYHIAIGFQTWGGAIGFIVNKQPWENLWVPMTMLNVWRIPLLFYVSGMGVYFAIQHRNWKQLLIERTLRIWLPFVFGFLVVVPIHMCLWQYANGWKLSYIPHPGHLWFLGNIFVYIIILLPVFVLLKKNEESHTVKRLKKWLRTPLSLVCVVIASVTEALWVNPMLYEWYAMTWHGFFLGIIAFFCGFCMILAGADFWKMMLKGKWIFLTVSVSLFIYRHLHGQVRVANYQQAIESNFWIFSVFAFSYNYLNKPSKVLNYLSQAAYPLYIIHMIFIFLASIVIFPLAIDVRLKFILVLLFTVGGALLSYEFLIKRIGFIRPLFGLKKKLRA